MYQFTLAMNVWFIIRKIQCSKEAIRIIPTPMNYQNISKVIFLGSIGRWATYLSVSLVKPIFYIPIYKKFINLRAFDNKNQINPFEKINTPAFIDLLEYDLIFDEIVIDKNLKNTVRMYHFIFSHWPVQVNRNCEEVNSLTNIISYEQEAEEKFY